MPDEINGLKVLPSRDQDEDEEKRHPVQLSVTTVGGFQYIYYLKPLTDNEIECLKQDLEDPNRTVSVTLYTDDPYRYGGEKFYPIVTIQKRNTATFRIERYKP